MSVSIFMPLRAMTHAGRGARPYAWARRRFDTFGWVRFALVLAGVILGSACSGEGGGDGGDDESCFLQNIFGPNFDCNEPGNRGLTLLKVGTQCWEDVPETRSDYRLRNYSMAKGTGNAWCDEGLYCNKERGCQPPIGSGESCEDIPPGLLWGVCADLNEACYPSEPVREGDSPGPRVCRKLPSKEGEWCDATVKADCDIYVAGGAACEDSISWTECLGPGSTHYGPAHAWINTSAYGYPNHTWISAHGDSVPFHYPVFRVHDLICQNQRCTPPPKPGEACAILESSLTYPATGSLAAVCQQPASFKTARFGKDWNEWRAPYDFDLAVLCLEGICTPLSTLEPDRCVTTEPVPGPEHVGSWCTTTTAVCQGLNNRCMSPCRPDGTCGMCQICESFEGERWTVSGPEDCAPGGNGWALRSEVLDPESRMSPSGEPEECRPSEGRSNCPYGRPRGDECHQFMFRHTFRPTEPATGSLWLNIEVGGRMNDPERTLDIFVNGTYLYTWYPEVNLCGRTSSPAVLELELPIQFHQASSLRVELQGSPAACLACRRSQQDIDERRIGGTSARITLENRAPSYLGLVRDDSVCPPMAPEE